MQDSIGIGSSQQQSMKIYLLLATLLLFQTLSYRYVDTEPLAFSPPPQSIAFLNSYQLVAQTNDTIKIYNTVTAEVEQTFTSDTNNPTPQVSSQLNTVLFKNKGSLYQMQPNIVDPLNLTEAEPFPYWVYPFGIANSSLIAHQLGIKDSSRFITYINLDNNSAYNISYQNPNQNRVSGSGVVALSPNEYYFVSGGICNPEINQQVLFLFQGNQTNIELVYNITTVGCTYKYKEDKKEQPFSSIDTGNGNRLHSVTYILDEIDNFRLSTTKLITQSSNNSFLEWTQFDVLRQIGIGFIGNSLYAADDLLCRLTEHYPANYAAAAVTPGSSLLLDLNITKIVAAYDGTQALALDGSNMLYFLQVNPNGTFANRYDLTNPKGQIYNNGVYFTSNYWFAKDQATGNLWVYDSNPNVTFFARYNTKRVVTDFCITQAEVLYIVENINGSYVLSANNIEALLPDGVVSVLPGPNVTLSTDKPTLSCLDAQTVLVDTVAGQNITVWKTNGSSLSLQGSLLKPAYFQTTFVSPSAIIFQHPDGLLWQFYNFQLVPISGSISIIVPPIAVYKILSTQLQDNIMLVAVGDDLTQLVSLDYYLLVNNNLVYQGTFPLVDFFYSDINRIVYLPTIGKISIDYSKTNNDPKYGPITIAYNITSPPQQFRGHFLDATALDCSGYFNPLFRLNPVTNTKEMIIINALNKHPILQRYSFTSATTVLLPLTASAPLNDYVYTKMRAYFDQTQQNILIYGIQQSSGLSDTVHVRNANSLETTFTEVFFSEKDTRDVQAFGLYGSNLVYAVTNISDNVDNATITISEVVASQGKVPTGNPDATIDLFAVCALCSNVAVATANSQLIQLVSFVSGLVKTNISTPCPVVSIVISADGSKIAYQCSDNGLYVYDNNIEKTYFQTNIYTNITNYYFLSNSWLVIVNSGTVEQFPLSLSLTPNKKIGAKVLTKADSGNVAVAVDNLNQVYAFSPAPQQILIYNFNGTLITDFFLQQNDTVVALAFDPFGQLAVTTTNSNLITITPVGCSQNSTESSNYCVCDNSFANVNGSCQCSPSLSFVDGSCSCGDGNYFVSSTECGECNVMCKNCFGSGVSNCDGYSVIFVIIIVIALLILAGVGVVIYVRSRKGPSKAHALHLQRSKSRSKSSEVADPFLKEGDEKYLEKERDEER